MAVPADKFLTATMTPDQIPTIQNANPPDPLAAEKIHICNVNWRVMQALLAKDYKFKWNYALTNPGEVVAEVFTAAMRKQNVPRGLAAVYVAYGGIRSPDINATLQESFGGRIPNIAEPEDAVAIINAP